jgi:hypothetical protein
VISGDVGYKSEGIISVDEFLDESRSHGLAGDIADVLSSAPKTARATSSLARKTER